MLNKKSIIIIIIVALVLGLVIFVFSNKNEITVEQSDSTEFTDYTNTVLELLQTAENDYISIASSSSIYQRSDFYNETRMNMDATDGYITITDTSSIELDVYKVCNSDGNELEELPETTYGGEIVEIASPLSITEGEYYLIKYQPYSENYSYYYISQLTNIGFQTLELYIITEGESIGNTAEIMDDIDLTE